MKLRLIGYWRNQQHPEYPHAGDLVDESWDADEREFVGQYLRWGQIARAYMGLSPCRVCAVNNGSLELTDGVYLWPQGLAHYVEDHGVRLPQAFVDHIWARQDGLESAESDLTWWLQQPPGRGE